VVNDDEIEESAQDADDEDEVSAPDDDEESEERYHTYWLEQVLNDEMPVVGNHLMKLFVQPLGRQPTMLKEDRFRARLISFLQADHHPRIPLPSSELSSFLFERAVEAHRTIAAYEATVRKIKGPEFSVAIQCVQQELERSECMAYLLALELKQQIPQWMSEWHRARTKAFEDFQYHVNQSLNSAKIVLDVLGGMRTHGRTDVISQILWIEKSRIRKRIADSPLAGKTEILLAGYAFAAQLLPGGKDATAYVKKIKQRALRAPRSKAGLDAVGMILNIMVCSPTD
jgi:hypothetical protein